MVGYLVRRAAWSLVTLVAFVTVAFFAVHLLFPFDFVTFQQAGMSPEAIAARRAHLGLDRPVVVQYLDYLAGLATFSLGSSFAGQPVGARLWAVLPQTVLIFVVGGVFAYLFGSWLGRFVAWQRRRLMSGATTTASVLAYTAFPPWLVFVLVYFLTDPLWAARSRVGLPVDSLRVWRDSPWEPQTVMWRISVSFALALVVALVLRQALRRMGMWRWATLVSLPLPFAAAVGSWFQLGFGPEALDLLFRSALDARVGRGSYLLVFVAFFVLAFGEITFVIRTTVAAERDEPYVTTARAKGLAEVVVRERHVAPNAVLPALSRLYVSVPYVLAGLIIIEREFALEGLSTVFFEAVETVDIPLVIGTLVVIGLVLIVLRLLLETAHAAIDPRLRRSTKSLP